MEDMNNDIGDGEPAVYEYGDQYGDHYGEDAGGLYDDLDDDMLADAGADEIAAGDEIAVDTGAPEDEPEVKAEEAAAGEVQDAPKTTKETRKSQRYPEGATPVMLGNLHWNTTDAEVETACKEYGKVLLLQFVEDKTTGRSKGVCIVLFDDKMSAEGAVSGLHHSMMGTRPVNCVIPEPATIRMLVEAGSLPAGNYGYGHMMGRKQPPPGRAPQPMAMPAPMMAAPGAPPMVRPPGMGPGMPGLPMGPMPGMAPAPPPGRPMAGKGGGGGRGQGPVCFHCKQPGHRANECPHRGMGPGMGGPGMGGPGMGGPGMGGPGMMPMGGPGMGGPMGAPHMGGGGMRPMGPGGAVCFICGQPGHRQNECPQAGRGYGGRGY